MVEGRSDKVEGGRIRLGMVGGGQGAFIGAVHRLAARMDDQYELVAGALSSNKKRALASAKELGLDPDRSYGSYEEMAKAEAARPDGIDAVAIVTPNNMHAPVAKAFLNAGINVICDKPLSTTVKEAQELVRLVKKTGLVFVLTHNYTGYPMIRQARAMVEAGKLGDIRVVQAEYAQDWLTEKAEATANKQAKWRTDPKQSGAGGSIGDIGYVAGLGGDTGSFKTPTLREIARTAPYMHDGSLATLDAVIDHYAAGGEAARTGMRSPLASPTSIRRGCSVISISSSGAPSTATMPD